MTQSADEQRQILLKQLQCGVKAGTVIFKEGDKTHDLYILLSGVIEVFKGEKSIAVIDKPDTYFGEMSTLLGLPRTATLVSVEDCALIKIPAEKVIDFFNHSPSLALKLSQILAMRLQEMNAKQENMPMGEIGGDYGGVLLYERLVCTPARKKFMSIYSKNIGSEMPLEQLSSALAVAPAEIGRVVTDYDKTGLIRSENNTIYFLEPPNDEIKQQIAIFAGAQAT